MTSAPTRKAKGDRLTRATKLIDKMNEQFDRIDEQMSAAKKAGNTARYKQLDRRLINLEERRAGVEDLVDRLMGKKTRRERVDAWGDD